MDGNFEKLWPKSCAFVHMCGSVENGKLIHKRLTNKFGDLIESAILHQASDGAVLQLTTKKISETTYKAILSEIGTQHSLLLKPEDK